MFHMQVEYKAVIRDAANALDRHEEVIACIPNLAPSLVFRPNDNELVFALDATTLKDVFATFAL